MQDRYKANTFLLISDNHAIKVSKIEKRIASYRKRKMRIANKYSTLDSLNSGVKIAYLSAILAHLSSAILAGINIAPILFSVNVDLLVDVSAQEYAKVLLPVVVIFFLSLIIGVLVQKISFEKNEVVPFKINYKLGYIIGAFLVLIIYLGLIYHVIQIGIESLPNDSSKKYVHLIGWLSFAELVTGFFAHTGWSLALYLFRMWKYERKIEKSLVNKLKAHQNCELYYSYYTQVEKPEEIMMTSNIERVISGED